MRAKSGRKVTNCILSPPLKTVTDISIYIISSKKEKKILLSSREEIVSAFDVSQSRFNNNTVCNYGALRVSI